LAKVFWDFAIDCLAFFGFNQVVVTEDGGSFEFPIAHGTADDDWHAFVRSRVYASTSVQNKTAAPHSD
jgi:hypothetical protein